MGRIKEFDEFFEKGKKEEKEMEETEETFEELMQKADEAYKAGKFREAWVFAIDALHKASGKNETAMAERRVGWGLYKDSFEAELNSAKHLRYSEAGDSWKHVLRVNPDDVDVVISAIKGLMLLPMETKEMSETEIKDITLSLNKELAELYQTGEQEIEKRASGQEARNLKAELLNSLGVEVRKYDPETASEIFSCGYMMIELKTREAGNLQHNKGTCYLMLKNQTEDKAKKLVYAKMAIIYLEWALQEYPKDQKAHCDRVQDKIDNTLAEIKNNFE